MKKIYDIFNVIIITAGSIWGCHLWRTLPDEIPAHFGFSGKPDRWTNKGWELIGLILLPPLMALFLYGLLAFSKRHTFLLNIPQKKKFLSLPKEKQKPFWDLLSQMISGLISAISILFYSLLHTIEQVAYGKLSGLSWVFISCFAFFIIYSIVYSLELNKMLNKCLTN
ncbi:DUF1648 domain-containing protein [candidate division WOR-3 bacterium]|nr:DUF1648 domain-containing protein [candidate division WOR-3 bacterium]